MRKSSRAGQIVPFETAGGFEDELTTLLRVGARKMLQAAIEEEVEAYIAANKAEKDDRGYRLVVRNGHHPERSIQTGIGPISVRKPKVNDKRVDSDGERLQFQSNILPPYLKRTKSVEELVPWLYLRGISSGDFPQALQSILGDRASGLSATSVVRLKKHWEQDFVEWSQRDLSGEHFVYFWADGIYPRVRLEGASGQCFLVIMGATVDGHKRLVAIGEGMRESELAWREVLLDLKKRGLKPGPEIAVGDGALGFWSAMSKEFPDTQHQRCWVHKTCNVLDKMPKSMHSKVKTKIRDIYQSASRKEAEQAMDDFAELFEAKYPRAVQCLVKDREGLLNFYGFPAQHWIHLRTTNPIESLFSTIRLRTKRTKGHGSVQAALAMAFKLAQCAENKWHRLRGSQLLADVIDINVRFEDGVKVKAA